MNSESTRFWHLRFVIIQAALEYREVTVTNIAFVTVVFVVVVFSMDITKSVSRDTSSLGVWW
jgi:hypothetical protein